MSDIDTSSEVLAAVRDALGAAAGRLDALATALPALPDAGDATADVAGILAELLGRAGEIGAGSHAAAQVMARTREGYRNAEARAARMFDDADGGR